MAAALGFRPQTPLASGGWGLRPQTTEWLLSSPVIVIFSKAFIALTSLVTVKKDKNLKIAIMFYFGAHFLLQTLPGHPSKRHWFRFLGIVMYYIMF